MGDVKTHKDLDVWKKAMELAKTIYAITRAFPRSEMLGLTSQMRRAAVSVPSNIAEGSCRGTDPDFIRFLYISLGSLAELETQVMLASSLEYIKPDSEILSEINNIRPLLLGLLRHVKERGKRDR